MNLKDRKILLTGGAGFVGSNLINHLLNEKSQVLLLDNFFSGKEEYIPDNLSIKKVDIRSHNLGLIIKDFKPDVVVHLAAIHYIPFCNENPELTFDVNVMGTRNILKNLTKGTKFFFASSAAVYPPLDTPLSEDISGDPVDIYGKTKLIAEDMVRLYSDNSIIGRLFNVYGPNETNPHVIPEIIDQIAIGNRSIKLGNLTPKRDYIHVEDICTAIISLLKHGKNDIYNIGTGKEYSVKTIVELISEILDKEVEIIQDEKRMRKVEREHLLPDITKISNITNWKPQIDFKSGLTTILP